MGLFKSRPRVAVVVPRDMWVGRATTLEVVLECKRAVTIDWLEVTLEGSERLQTLERWHTGRIGRWGVRLAGRSELPAGRSQWRARFEVPAEAPPSYAGRHVRIDYLATVHAALPFWPDRTRAFALRFGLPPRDEPGKACVISTAASGPSGTEPHLECSLASDVVPIGEKLVGAVSFQNVAWNRYRSLCLTFVGEEAVASSRGFVGGSHDGLRYGTELPLPALSEGESVPFALALPKEIAPSYTGREWLLRWSLEVRARCGWGREASLVVPLTLLPPRSGSATTARRAPPSVGSARVNAMWQQVALGAGMRLEEGALVAERDGAEIRVSTALRSDGAVLCAEIAFPSLELGLRGGPAGVWQRVLGAAIVVPTQRGNAAIEARDAGQCAALVAFVAPLCAGVELVALGDERIRVARRSAGQDPVAVAALANTALELASALAAARRAIPAPRCLAAHVAAWERLATGLGGQLERARMAVHGHFEGREARVITGYDDGGAPDGTRIGLRVEPPLADSQELRFLPAKGFSRSLAALPPAARRRLIALAPKVVALTFAKDWLEVVVPAPLAEPLPLATECLAELDALGRLLALSNAGPYR